MTRLTLVLLAVLVSACGPTDPPSSTSGAQKVTPTVTLQASGMTVEQENITRRPRTGKPAGLDQASLRDFGHVGDVLLYSTVKGKVTSSGKRLSPYTVSSASGLRRDLIPFDLGEQTRYTTEVLQDDGTYGASVTYLYWWDTRGIYHQHYVSGGQIVHLSDQPIAVPKVILNLETTGQ